MYIEKDDEYRLMMLETALDNDGYARFEELPMETRLRHVHSLLTLLLVERVADMRKKVDSDET